MPGIRLPDLPQVFASLRLGNSQSEIFILSAGLLAIYLAGITIYRLYFHPLARIPGPKVVAVSRVYEWYCDCVQFGTFVWKIQEWHRQYGPIVRIGPNEVHVDDPDWYSTLYSSKLDKDPWYYGFLGNCDSAFATESYEAHRMIRKKQDPFFSRTNVDKFAPSLGQLVQRLLSRFEEFQKSGNPIKMRLAFKSFATDAVCAFCFPEGTDFVSSPDFAEEFHSGQESLGAVGAWIRHLPILGTIVFALPDWVVAHMDKQTQAAVAFNKFGENQAKESIRQSDANEPCERMTVIREMYESDMPAEFRTSQKLENEALVLTGAGIATVSRILECGVFYVLQNREVTRTLTEELRAYRPGDSGLLTHRELETLPYLTAVITECQRRIPAVLSRFSRINRYKDKRYQDYLLPMGTTISMCSGDVQLCDRVWGNPLEFDPSRWLDPVYKWKMRKYMVPFSRGSRNCVGQNFATAELYMVIGNFFRRFDAELFETDARDIEVIADSFNPYYHKDSVGVQVVLTQDAA